MEEQNKQQKPLTDKSFSRFVLTSVLGILACIVCLCSTTYAWFSDSAQSTGNQINIADRGSLDVEVSKGGIVLAGTAEGIELEAGVAYVITLSLQPGSASGYCVIKGEDGTAYYTDYILGHTDAVAHTIAYVLTVEKTQTVTFTTRWGIYHSHDSSVVNNAICIK